MFQITEFTCLGVHYKLKSPLVLMPHRSDDGKVFTVQNTDLGISLYAQTLDELYELIQYEFSDLWINYVLEEDSKLDAKAIEIKRNLIALVEQEETPC